MIVYLITNKINGKRYVGQTVNSLDHRWNLHIGHSRNPKRSGVLCSAIRKYGPENFQIKLLVKCDSIEEMNHRETYYINKIFKTLAPNGYNLDGGGKNNIMHPETKRKLSIAHTGKKRGPFSEEHRRRLSEANKGQNLGGTLPEETCRKISIANSGENSYMFGRKQTEKNKQATSKANTGNKYWEGRTHNEESKEKMSKSKEKFKKPIYCITNDTLYSSKHEASRILNVGRKEIGRNISGEISHVKSFVFKKA